MDVGRRHFLIGAGVVGAGLVVGVQLARRDGFAGMRASRTAAAEPFAPHAFLRIAPDDTITVIIGKSEMGQGVYTGLPMILAEELDIDPRRVRVEFAPLDPAFNHPFVPMQFTGGSMSTTTTFEPLRKAGAAARAMLLAAAAKEWQVEAADLSTADGFVTDGARRASYGSLATTAAALETPKDVLLKSRSEFKYLGKPLARLDTPDKVDGRAEFGCDVRRPGMLFAMVARAPVFGGKVTSVRDMAARAVPGVVEIKRVPSGVAVIATHTWAALRGRDALEIEWDLGPGAEVSTDALREEYRRLAREPGIVAESRGDVNAAFAASGRRRLEVEYDLPYLAHACMEPLNCVAHVTDSGCEIWTGTQYQSPDAEAAAKALGISPQNVKLHTTFLGGGFGRRACYDSDFVVEAVHVARGMQRPVQTVWTREDDMRGGYYRPLWYSRVQGAIDSSGLPVAWRHTIVGQPVLVPTQFAPFAVKDGIDPTSVEGAAGMAYTVPNVRVEVRDAKVPVPVLWWRSVGHTHTGFVVNSFLDELAHLGGRDPLEVRRALLAGKPRHLAVLNAAAEESGWGGELPAGVGRGIALHESFGSIVAQVAEVAVSGQDMRVQRVVCAVDCGFAVNPGQVEAQMESGIVYGLSAALRGEITIAGGHVQQGNFHDYPVLRLNEMPRVETYIVASDGPLGGAGEPGVPCIAPAVTNAIFAATGKRIRRLPIVPQLART